MFKFIFSLLCAQFAYLNLAFADIDQQSGGEPLMNVSLSNSSFEKIETSSFYEYVSNSKKQLMAFTTKVDNRNIQIYLYNPAIDEVKEFQLDLDLISADFQNVINTGNKSLKSKRWEKVYFP